MLLLALALATQQAAPPPPTPAGDAIIVTGNRWRDALAKCLARGCPPEEEVEAAMNAGAEAFAAGRYEESKAILRRAVTRNRKYAAQMPTKMADLYATYADVAEQEGDDDAFRLATLDSVDVLRKHLGRENPTTLAASVRAGDMLTRLGKVGLADQSYKSAIADARRGGNLKLAGLMTFRRAWLHWNAGNKSAARAMIADVREMAGGDARLLGLARVLEIRMALADGDEAAADRLLAQVRGTPGADPVLVSAPAYPQLDSNPSRVFEAEGPDLSNRFQGRRGGDIRWVDIGFWVRPDGTTDEAEILRPAKDNVWARGLVKQVQGRRYARLAGGDEAGLYRIERFTLRPNYLRVTGTRIPGRGGEVTLHVVDMTRLAMRDAAVGKP